MPRIFLLFNYCFISSSHFFSHLDPTSTQYQVEEQQIEVITMINELYHAITVSRKINAAQKIILHNVVSYTNDSIAVLFNVSI